MSRLAKYLKPLQQFVQQNPIVFWSTLGLSVLVIILFVFLPSKQSDTVRLRERAERLRTLEPGPVVSGDMGTPERVDDDLPPIGRNPALPPQLDPPERRAPAERTSKPARMARGGQSGGFTVQVGSFTSEKSARQLSMKLETSGYPAFVKAARLPGKGLTYRVRVGTFSSREQAQRFGEELVAAEESVKSVFATIND